MSVTISAIIPTHNRWPLVRRAVDSVLTQNSGADELIVVDDGSTDDTSAKLQHHYGDQLRVITQPNRGVSAARNTGITAANGEWIALLDSDDEWLPEKLKLQRDVVEGNDSCVLCHTDEIWIRNGVRVNPMNKHKKSGGDIFADCLPLCAISPSSVLIRKTLFNTVGTFDKALPACEDYDLWLRICAIHRVHYLETPLLKKYGGHEDQLSRKYWGMDRFRIKALQKMLRNGDLSPHQSRLTKETLKTKTIILLKGAIKHKNLQLVEECRELLHSNDLQVPEALQ